MIDVGGSVASFKQELGSMVITQSPVTYALLGTSEKLLPPLSVPTAVELLPAIGYKQITAYIDDGSDGVSVSDGKFIIEKAGLYYSTVAYATFMHSANSAVVGFVFGFERDGLISFSQRPIGD